MTRIPKNISGAFLALFLFSFLAAKSSEFIKAFEVPCAVSTDFASNSTFSETNITLIPGYTQKLNINLKAHNDSITFEFMANITHPSIFKLSTFANGNSESVSMANFNEQETLTVLLDNKTKVGFISGDKGFSLTRSLPEDYYEVIINHEVTSEIENTSSLPSHKSKDKVLFHICSIFGGIITVFCLTFGRNRLKELSFELSIRLLDGKVFEKKLMARILQFFKPVNQKEMPSQNQPKYVQEEDNGLGIMLDMDFEEEKVGRRMPTTAEIRALVKEMQDNGMVDYDCNPSEDTDTEDQYEAPALPNYFCCMMCFSGTRCTVAEPCRHIFACESCIKELSSLCKKCILCDKNVTAYEPL